MYANSYDTVISSQPRNSLRTRKTCVELISVNFSKKKWHHGFLSYGIFLKISWKVCSYIIMAVYVVGLKVKQNILQKIFHQNQIN